MSIKTEEHKALKPVTIKVDPKLNAEITHALADADTLGLAKFAGLAEFYRQAWQAYIDGMPLTRPEKRRRTARLHVRMTHAQVDHWNTLPPRKRSQVIERAARTYLKTRVVRRIDYAKTKSVRAEVV
ncbi:MAG: hypothetical protein QNK37_29590 [Acidobacteriota bacterium]|nr:hypothetical protein [Acidobacteriota bacterium]